MAEQSRPQFPMLVVPGREDPGETRAHQVPISRGPAAPRQEEIRTPGLPARSLEGNFTVGLYILEGGKRALYNGNTDTNVNLSNLAPGPAQLLRAPDRGRVAQPRLESCLNRRRRSLPDPRGFANT